MARRRLGVLERVHSAFFTVLFLALVAMLGAFALTPFLAAEQRIPAFFIGMIAAPLLLFGGTWVVCRVLWRCRVCAVRLPTAWRRGVTSPVAVRDCPACGVLLDGR